MLKEFVDNEYCKTYYQQSMDCDVWTIHAMFLELNFQSRVNGSGILNLT